MRLYHKVLYKLSRVILVSAVMAMSGAVTAQSVFSDVQQLLDEKKFEDAIKHLIDLTVSRDKEAEKYQLLAQAYLETGAGIAAEAALDRSRRLGADYAVTAVPYAKALLVQGRYAAARESLLGVIIPEQHLRDSYIISGDTNFAENEFEAARRDYLKAQTEDPEDFQSYLGLARLELREGKLQEAQTLAEEARSRANGNTMVHYTLGLIARYLGQAEEAEKFFTESVRLYEDNIMANIELASIRINQGRIGDAEAYLDKVYAVSPNQSMALYLTAVIQASRGQYEEASALLNRTRGISDSYLPAVYVKGMVAYQLGKNDIAVEALNKVVGARPDNRVARLALAASYMKLQRPVTALKILDPLLKGGKDLNAVTIAGAAAMQAGDAEKGKQYYQQASELKKQGQEGGADGLSTKLALAEYAVGNTEQALVTLSAVTAGSEVDLRELGLMGSMQIKSRDYTAARQTINKVLSLAPQRALGYNMLGTLEFRLNEFQKAITSYSKAIDINADYHTARRNRGLSYMRLGEHQKARRDFREVLSNKPDDVMAKAALAKTLLLMGDAAEAVEYFREAVRVLPNSLELAADFSEALANSGNTARAIEQSRKAAVMAQAQDKPETLKRMGLLLLKLKEPAAAERPLSRYVAYNPYSGEAHLLHGRAMLQTGLYTGAIMSFLRAGQAVESQPDTAALNWYFFAAEALSHKYEDAQKRLQHLDESQRPEDIDPSVVGDFLFSMGQLSAAEASYRKVLSENESSSNVIIGLATTLAQQDRTDEAIEGLLSYLADEPSDRLVLATLGSLYEGLQQYEKASQQYEKILQIGVADAHIAARLATMYLQLGNNRSIKMASSAHLMMPDDPYILDVYGWIMLQAGRNTEASVTALEKAVRRSPASAVYRYHLGMAYLARGQRYDAQQMLTQALSLSADFPGAAEAKRQLALLE